MQTAASGCRPCLALPVSSGGGGLRSSVTADCLVVLLQTWNAWYVPEVLWYADGKQTDPDDFSPISGLIAKCAGRNANSSAGLEVGWAGLSSIVLVHARAGHWCSMCDRDLLHLHLHLHEALRVDALPDLSSRAASLR